MTELLIGLGAVTLFFTGYLLGSVFQMRWCERRHGIK